MLIKLLVVVVSMCTVLFMCDGIGAVTFEEAQGIKVEQLQIAAEHAIDQQRVGSFSAQAVDARYKGKGNVVVEESGEWDVDGDGKCLKVTVKDIAVNYDHVNIADRLAIRFKKPMDLLAKSTGIAFWIRTSESMSRDIRFGAHFKCEGTDQDPVIISDTPVVQKFGDNPQQVYLDWGYSFGHEVRPMRGAPKELLTRVNAIELTFVQKRLPRADVRLSPASGTFYIDGVELVDWYDGSYDSDRFPKGGKINAKQPITSQGRTQQVAVICAMFGGEAGAKSAIRALDMMARIQCWDGSWPVLQTRLQGEYTFGMILADMARAYQALREQGREELDEVITVRQWKMKRGELYEQMIYRASMSRAPGPFHTWRDSYFAGEGSLTGGCNRPMYFAVSQYVAAGVLSSDEQRKEIIAEYDKNMDDLIAYQGITAGGWPIFGEGNRYGGKGLHWDCSYTTDHVFIMAIGSRATGDARWGVMMKKFDTVVEAMMLVDGLRIDGGLSERGRARSGGLKSPDIVYQEAMKHGATKLAQWGANVSQRAWRNWPNGGSMWPSCTTMRGYGLGAFLTWLTYDMQASPEPVDLGHVFSRQWPIWTARWMSKDGGEVRRSKIILRPHTQEMINTYSWEVGQYPVLESIPLAMEVEGDCAVDISPVDFTGDVSKLASDGMVSVEIVEGGKSRKAKVKLDEGSFDVEINGPAKVRVTFAGGEEIEFDARPRKEGMAVVLKCRLLRKPEAYKHLYVEEEAADVDVADAGVNMVDPATGTKVVAIKCYPNPRYGISRAFDGSGDTVWLIGGFKGGTGLRFEFAKEVSLAKIVINQGDWQGKFHIAKDVTVKLSDGTTKKLTLERKPGMNVELELGGVKAKSLTLMVDSIYEAKDNDSNSGGWNELVIMTAADE